MAAANNSGAPLMSRSKTSERPEGDSVEASNCRFYIPGFPSLRFRFAALRFCVLVVRKRFLAVFFFMRHPPVASGRLLNVHGHVVAPSFHISSSKYVGSQ